MPILLFWLRSRYGAITACLSRIGLTDSEVAALRNALTSLRCRSSVCLGVHPKFYLFDAGVYRAIRPSGPVDRPEEIDGAALETLVFHELRAAIAYRSLKLELFFWRTAAGAEVDFVAYGGSGLYAIEVKRSRTVRHADLRGLRQFKSDYPMARCLLLFGGDRREYHDGIELLPVSEALADPASILTPPHDST